MGMIGDPAGGPTGPSGGSGLVYVGIMKSGKGVPKKRSIETFMTLKGFGSRKYGFKLTPKGRDGNGLSVYDVYAVPKSSSGVSGISAMSAQLKEAIMGRRPYTPHGSQRIDPDEFYNENDNYTVMDNRDVNAALGIGAGAGAFGTPAHELISGYEGPIIPAGGKFPYASGVGQAKTAWQPTGISLGTDYSAAAKQFNAMLPQLKTSDPSAEYKMGPGAKVTVVKIQRRRAGFFWDTVVTVPNPTDEAVRAAADEYKRKHPDATLRTKPDTTTGFTVFKR